MSKKKKSATPTIKRDKKDTKKTSKKATSKSKKSKVKVLKSKRKFQTDKDAAMDFAIKAHERFAHIIKASILFGSQAKNSSKSNSDIDIILIIDDAAINWDLELTAWYREELGKLISKQDYGCELHINSVKLTTFWQDLQHGDPVVINILRYGQALLDTGSFFNPIKALLLQGKIKSTPEAIHAALMRAPRHIAHSKLAEVSAIEGVYWAIIDSAQAALMSAGKLPPSPEHIPQMLKETFVDSGLLKVNFVRAARDIYTLHKEVTHQRVPDIKGSEVDEWQEVAERFLLEMTRLINLILERKKENESN
tara:strand:- start:667 stop:1590 length:924 start_codon:yes stop_codon:yes gene_type:complete